jgi:Ca-activated chloride channel homolog
MEKGGTGMTDDLDAQGLEKLGTALRKPPAVDPQAREAALRLAMENFDRLQGSTEPMRPSQDRPIRAGFWMGVKTMLSNMNLRPSLVATTSVAALCLGVVIMLPPGTLNRGGQPGVIVDGAALPKTAGGEVADKTIKPEAPAVVAPEPTPVPEMVAEAQRADVATKPREETAPLAGVVTGDDAGPAEGANQNGLARTAEAPPLPEADALAQGATAGVSADYGAAVANEMLDAEAPLAQGYVADAPSDARTRAQPEMAASVAPAPADATIAQPEPNTEAFANADFNPVKVTAEEPVSTFSIDTDTASYSIIRQSLSMGMLPPADAVRIEEMVNYFPYAYPAPDGDIAPFAAAISVMPTPWNEGTRLVRIGLQGALPAIADRPPLNLVFLIDTSGSMDEPNKLPLLKQSIALALSELRPQDQVAMVAYAGSAGEVLPPTAARDRDTILRALDNLAAGGSTAGAEGIELAYQVAGRMAGDGEVSRVLIATDGDFNVGLSDPAGLEAYVAKQRETGIYLSVLGFGRGNLDDAVMQSLSQNGNGTAAYIDTLSEARKVLVDQLTGMLFPIADDVKIQVEWNPAAVAEYRLIGYETRALAREDFNNDRVDAGEIGAGHQVTAIYEVTAPGSKALRNDPLRYGAAPATDAAPAEIGFLRLRYKAPGTDTSTLIETPITGTEPATDEARFAAAVAGFGQLLQGATYLGDWGWEDAIALAVAGRGEDTFGYRAEAINMMRLAESLSR